MAEQGELIVSVSGIRGIIGESLTPQVALAFASALGAHVAGGSVVVRRDGRPSGTMLRHAVLAGLAVAGCEIHDVGVAPTPTVGLAVRHLNAAGGVQITASHNPAPWNGLKLFGSNGRRAHCRHGRREIKRSYEERPISQGPLERPGHGHALSPGRRSLAPRARSGTGGRPAHPRAGLPGLPRRQRRRRRPAGPNCWLVAVCWTSIGHRQGGDADGHFVHRAGADRREPARRSCANGPPCEADIGFVLDPDADRLAIIDEKGQYIGEELTLALAVLFRLRQQTRPGGHQHVHLARRRGHGRQAGRACHRSAVGEANVVEEMRRAGRGHRRRRQRRRHRSARRLGARSVHRHGPDPQPPGRDRQASSASWSPSCRPITSSRTSTPSPRERLPSLFQDAGGEAGPRRRSTASTACGWTGPTAGCTFGPATPSRSSASSPRRRRRRPQRNCAAKWGGC